MTDSRTADAPLTAPIFILGILPRCGTNFLSDLLCAHPDCEPPEPIWEDCLIRRADRLADYVETVSRDWNPKWGVGNDERDQLYARLGDGLCSFLNAHTTSQRVVTKTPRVDNLPLFFRLFPDAHLLILLRDGRAVLESGIKSFGWNRESAMHRWADAAKTVLSFDETHRDTPHRYLITHYEELWQNQEQELRRILDFLDLDTARYDFGAAANLPLRGSSTVRTNGETGIHWKPVEKPPDFDPTQRFKHWRRARHERFEWVAGDCLHRLDYHEPQIARGGSLWTAWNLVMDLRWLVIRTLGPLYLRLAGKAPQKRG